MADGDSSEEKPGEEAKSIESVEDRIGVEVSPDRIEAVFRFEADAGPVLAAASRDELVNFIRGRGAFAQTLSEEAVAAFHALLKEGKFDEAGGYVVARGRAAVDGEGARIEWRRKFFPAAEGEEDDGKPADDRVALGEGILVIVPATEPADGFDVEGRPLKAAKGADVAVTGSIHIRVSEDGRTFSALAAGRLLFEDNRLAIADIEAESLSDRIEIKVSPDRLTAAFHLNEGAGPALAGLSESGFRGLVLSTGEFEATLDEAAVAEIYALIKDEKYEDASGRAIARGKAAVDGEGAKIIWARDFFEDSAAEDLGDERADHFASRIRDLVKPGDEIATVVPPTEPEDGFDVENNPLAGVPGEDIAITASEDFEVSKDGRSFAASKVGRLVFKDNRLDIHGIYHIEGDVNFETGNVEFEGVVEIGGGIQDNFAVTAGGDLIVGGLVEGANISSGGDIKVDGGIIGKEKGEVRAEGGVTARFLGGARVTAGGDIYIENEIIDSKIMTTGSVKLERGRLSGGFVKARGGCVLNEIGSAANVATSVSVGLDPFAVIELNEIYEEIDKKTEAVEGIEKKIAPIRPIAAKLPPNKKAIFDKLDAEVEKLKSKIAELESRSFELEEQAEPDLSAKIVVNRTIHSGVMFAIGTFRTHTNKEISGPVTVRFSEAEEMIVFEGRE